MSQRALLLLPGTMGFIRAVWFVVVPITMLGELTGLRNVGLSLVGLSTLIAFRHDESFGLPAARPWTLVLLWSTASLVWSGAFDITLAKLKVDLFLPFLMFWSAWVMSKEIGLVRLLAHGTVAGLVALALLSLFVWIPTEYVAFLPSRWLHTYASVLRPLPRWYPGVGDASTAALFAGIFLMGATVAGRISIRAAAVGCAALVVVVAATGNRNVLILLPVALLLMGWRIWQTASKAGPANRRSLMTRVVVFTSIALVTVVAAVLLEYSARERLVQLKEPLIEGESASMQLVARDTRPFIWRYYLRLGSEAPWIGVGFGRTVPGIVHHTERDEELARVENNAYIHAHNLLLDWWLQTGLIGVCLFALLIVTLYRRIFQQERAAREAIESADLTARGHRALATGAMVLITMMLLRNMTDDFMVFGIAAFFWMLLGAMMGESELSARRTR